jgi:hypothetical protein
MARLVWFRLRSAPFEAAIAAIVVVQAAVSLAGWGVVDPLGELLPAWLGVAFGVSYLTSGAGILLGLMWPRGDVEGAALVLLVSALMVRALLYGQLLGWGPDAITSVAFSLFLSAGAALRLSLLRVFSRGA